MHFPKSVLFALIRCFWLDSDSIGVDKNYTAGTFFSGLIDDVRIYDMALTAEETEELVR